MFDLRSEACAALDGLESIKKEQLEDQINSIDWEEISKLSKQLTREPSNNAATAEIKRLPDCALQNTLSTEEQSREFQAGLRLIAANQVAVVIFSAGQGTRLGVNYPKGCYDIGLPSHSSLFQLQCERILKLQSLAQELIGPGKRGVSGNSPLIPLYIMTSRSTIEHVQKFFTKNDFFGLNKQNVSIFLQHDIPSLDINGKTIFKSDYELYLAPNGNGEVFEALDYCGVLDDMRKRGILHVHMFGVDNCLVKPADPVFVHLAASRHCDVATKAVEKTSPEENVGLIVLKNGKPASIEYTEISSEQSHQREPLNPVRPSSNVETIRDDEILMQNDEVSCPQKLYFRHANIVNHYFSFSFLETAPKYGKSLPYHIAGKKIQAYSHSEKKIVDIIAIKHEKFVFDIFRYCTLHKFLCYVVPREDEFSPLKNKPGTGRDDPETSRNAMLVRGRKWVESNGGRVVANQSGEQNIVGVEIASALSYGGEGLEGCKGHNFIDQSLIKSIPEMNNTEAIPAIINRINKDSCAKVCQSV